MSNIEQQYRNEEYFRVIANRVEENIKESSLQSSIKSINSLLNSTELFSNIKLSIPEFVKAPISKYSIKYVGINFEFFDAEDSFDKTKTLNLLKNYTADKYLFEKAISNIETRYSIGQWLRDNTRANAYCCYDIKNNEIVDIEGNEENSQKNFLDNQLGNDEESGDLRKSTIHKFKEGFNQKVGYIYSFARLIGYDGKKSSGNIALAIYSEDYLDINNTEQLKDSFEKVSYQCLEVLSSVKSIFLKRTRVFEHNAQTISAKAAIMGRNMSHNIGSHVIYYLRQHLNGDILQMHELLRNITIKEGNEGKIRLGYNEDTPIELNKNEIELPFLKGLGTFLTYLQERQDYIAAISSEYKPSYNSTNFKSFIIDNFLRDLKAKRHSHSDESKQENNVLLSYIAKSEDTKVNITLNGMVLDTIQAIKPEHPVHKYSIDIPGSTLGRQAFYSILENIIRNAAKHGRRSTGSNELNLDISIHEKYNLSETQKRLINNSQYWQQRYYQIRIKDNNNNNVELAQKIQESIKSNLINEFGQLIENEKGIKEIVISALWLNNLSITDIETRERLKYIDVEITQNNELEYIFYLTKSKNLIFIVADDYVKTNDITNELNEYAIITNSNLENNIDEISRYNLIVDVHNTVNSKYIKKFRRYLNIDLQAEVDQSFYFKDYSPTSIKDIANELHTNREKLYLFYYHWYVKDKFYKNDEFPKIALNIEANHDNLLSGYKSKLNIYKNLYLGYDEANQIIPISDDIYYNKGFKKRIAFRRHIHNNINEFFHKSGVCFNETDNKQYINLLSETSKRYLSVESITGDNSSFRILSNEEKNDLWTLKKIEAAAAKILIIDERIYDNFVYVKPGVMSVELENKIRNILKPFLLDNAEANAALNKFTPRNYTCEECIQIIDNICNEENSIFEDSILNSNFMFKCITFPNELKKIENRIIDVYVSIPEGKNNIKKTLLNHLKNTQIANINKNLDIINDFESKVGSFYLDRELNTYSTVSNNNNIQFDYISIHQGILDKLFLQVNPENTLTSMDKRDYSKQITSSLEKCFNAFKVVIHTGRGKPNYIKGVAPYRSLSDLDYALTEPKELILNYFESASYEL